MEQYSTKPKYRGVKSAYYSKKVVSIIKGNAEKDELIRTLKSIKNYDLSDSSGNTLLHIAAQYDNEIATKYMMKFKGMIDVQNNEGKTPLIVAIKNGCKDSAHTLIEANANLFITDNSNKSALHLFSDYEWHRLSRFVEKIIKKVESQCSENSENIAKKLYDAGWSLPYVFKLLKDIDVIKKMLEFGSQVDAREHINNFTSLHIAVFSKNIEHIKLLLDFNADPNAMDLHNRTPLNYVYNSARKTSNEDFEMIKLLVSKGALATIISEDASFDQVNRSLQFGNQEVIQLLLQAKLDLSSKYEADNTPVHILAKNRDHNAFKALENQNLDVNARNSLSQTPLWIAASYGNACAVEILLEKGADVNGENYMYHTPLYQCLRQLSSERESQWIKCVELLLEYNADVQRVVYDTYGDPMSMFGLVRKKRLFFSYADIVGELLMEQLVLQEVRGVPIREYVYDYYIGSEYAVFKDSYKLYKEQLQVKLYKSFTLFDLLGESDKNFERYARDSQFTSSIESFDKEWKLKLRYYNTVLQKRYSKAIDNLKMKKEAAITICKIMKTEYSRFPLIADQIVSYLEKQDLQNLLQVCL